MSTEFSLSKGLIQSYGCRFGSCLIGKIEICSISCFVEGFGLISVLMFEVDYNIWSSTTPDALSFQGNCGRNLTWETDRDLDFFLLLSVQFVQDRWHTFHVLQVKSSKAGCHLVNLLILPVTHQQVEPSAGTGEVLWVRKLWQSLATVVDSLWNS